jgi:hypothetical protein
VGTSERRGLFGTPRCRWEDNVRMDLKSVGRTWIGLMWLSGGLL